MICDLIPPKLVKVAADQLAEPLTCITNSAISQSIFPNKAKEPSITSADKEGKAESINTHFKTINQ